MSDSSDLSSEPSPANSSLASVLTTVLERRFLAGFDASQWRLRAADSDPGLPLLHELVAVGRPAREGDFARAMPHVLGGCHAPGHDLIVALLGQGGRHRLFYGLRRRSGGRSSRDAMAGLAGAFRGQIPGMEFGAAAPMSLAGHATLVQLLSRAPCLATITGIPSGRDNSVAGFDQGLHRLAGAVGNAEYLLIAVAEPLPVEVLEDSMIACRRLLEELHPLIATTVSSGRSHMIGRSQQTSVVDTSRDDVRAQLYVRRFLTCAEHLAPFCSPLHLTSRLTSKLIGLQRVAETQFGESTSQTTTDQEQSTLINADARFCSAIVERHHERLARARGTGWWRTAFYVAAADEAALQCVTRTVQSLATGDRSDLEPLRVQRPPESLVREAARRGQIVRLLPQWGDLNHPLGNAHEALATCMSSDELATLIHPPHHEIAGILIRERGEFALSTPGAREPSLKLGMLRDPSGSLTQSVGFSKRTLNEHVLVVGTPGSGKTNTCMQMLLEADRLRVPFLVIEPAKAEYRDLERLMGSRLRRYSIGDVDGLPLRLNPLRPVRGVPLLGHIDLLKAVFNASFAMYPGMPQILEEALTDVYENRGWSLYSSDNAALGQRATLEEEAVLTPCLADLRDQIDVVVGRRGYGQEVQRNLSAALRSRLTSLMAGTKGLILNTRRSTPLADLFERPVILELQHLRDDDEKSFVMALVLALMYQYCEARQTNLTPADQQDLQHVTLIEEAHRLLSATPSANAESADARGKGVSMFADMLAELRAKGEGFIIAEQIPTKLVSDVLKNTNLKIIHKLVSPQDRLAVGESANLNDSQRRHVATLSKGLAVVHGLPTTDGGTIAEAALVQVASVKDELLKTRTKTNHLVPEPIAEDRAALHRVGGCSSCASVCGSYAVVEPDLRKRSPASPFVAVAEAILAGDPQHVTDSINSWRSARSSRGRTDNDVFCYFVNEATAWTIKVLTRRGDDVGGSRMMTPADALIANRLSAAFGRFGQVVLMPTDSRPEAILHDALAQLSARLRAELTGSAPGPFGQACLDCPTQCTMLPWTTRRSLEDVSVQFLAAIPNPKTTGAFATIGGRWSRIDSALAPAERPGTPYGDGDPSFRRFFQYCTLAQLKISSEHDDVRNEVLMRLRTHT